MPQDSPDISGMVSDPGFLKLAPNDQREALQKLTGDESFGKLSDEDVGQFISKVSPEKKTSGATGSWLPKYSVDPKNKDFTLPPGLEGKQMLGTPISPAGAAASLPRAAIGIAGGYGAGKIADQFTKNPWIHDAATMVGSLATESIASGAREMANFPARQVARDMANKVAGKSMADWIMPPPPEPPGPTLSEQATQIVEKQLAVKAARVQAGLDPPAEDTMAEVLRKEFLEPPKKSSVPQNIPLPKATTPTYVPEGTPGARGSPAPEFSKLSEGPTAASHQVARQNALEEMRNATINKPGWVSKLPDRVTFKKLSPIQQRTLIQQAVASDPQAAGALRTGSRIGSAGDLASWTPEQLWSRYMKEYSSTTPDEGLKQTLKNEIARRGQVTAAPNQFRP